VLQEVTEFGLGGAVKVIDSIPYEQMPELYAEAIASVSVPYSDGTPMSLLEAMACGSVPIFSDLPSVREWVSHGVNGFLVAPEDHEALAAHLIHLIRNPDVVARIVSMNRALVEERASQRVHMERMATIYRSLVGSVPIR